MDHFMQLERSKVSSGDVTSRVRRGLNQSGYSALRAVDVLPIPGGICLSGRVSTYYLKQLAQSLAMETDGVHIVENELIVD
jgi:osmotically-inducible protein OsmY